MILTTGFMPLPLFPCCRAGHKAWAFGLGLERLAMVLFDIPDIRWVGVTDGLTFPAPTVSMWAMAFIWRCQQPVCCCF